MKDFIEQNKHKLNAREQAIVLKELNAGRMISWVSQDTEPALYTWYALGKSTKEIADITQVPECIVLLTFLKYDWAAKLESMKAAGTAPVSQLAQDTTNQVFALTMLAIQRDIAEVMAGKKDPRTSKYVPQNAVQLLTLLESLQNTEQLPIIAQPSVVYNTQVNITETKATTEEPKQLPAVTKLQLLKQLAKEDVK